MTSISTENVDNRFIFLVVSRFLYGKMDQGINLANIRGLVTSTFFIMTVSKELFCHMYHRYS